MDKVSQKVRSRIMSSVRSTNTKPEIAVRSLLHRLGYRFRLHADLPGKPDIVLGKYASVVFVHGCFWHRHQNCSRATMPQTNVVFWEGKFNSTVARDQRNAARLRRNGWSVLTVWECQLSNPETVARRLDKTLKKRLSVLSSHASLR